MKFGYLLFVAQNEKTDYLKLAYSLALSIKLTQKEGYDKVALVIDDKTQVSKLKSSWVFDEVLEWKDNNFFWNGRSWMDKLSPWEYTVCLDVDMLFFRDYSHWIDFFIDNEIDLFLPCKAFTYRGEIIISDHYRKTFTANELPNLYSFYTFFNKKNIESNFFSLGRHILCNPDTYKNSFLSNYKPSVVGTDEALSLSAKLLGLDNITNDRLDIPRIVHLKPMVQNWPWPADSVSDHVGFYFDLNGNLKIGNYQQYDIVHFNEKNLITDEVVTILENKIWKK